MQTIANLMIAFNQQQLALPIWFEQGQIHLINQLKLPFKEEIISLNAVSQLADKIKDMSIRGSGAIAIAGAYGLYLVSQQSHGNKEKLHQAARLLKATRPTAVNLMKTIDEIITTIDQFVQDKNGPDLVEVIEAKVCDILTRQLNYEYALGRYGAELIADGDTILTHCHSGALAGSGYGGRALSVIRCAFEQGKKINVLSSETRPYLQGARITIYELEKFGIPHKLICDNMSGYLIKQGMIDKVIVGSDRVTANGDLLNKVGTYMHALAAKAHNIPFYTATSSHTIDFNTAKGEEVEVEFRDGNEVTHLNQQWITVPGTQALYPSFDVTPAKLISAIITEQGVFAPDQLARLQ